MKDVKPHPIAELFPLMDADQLKELASDIKSNGLQEPIILLDGMILDGRNRFDACKIAGVRIENTAEWFETFSGEDPLGYVLSHNLLRRHLTTAVRAEIAAKIANMRHGGDRKTEINPPDGGLISQAAAAKAVGVSERSVQRAAAKLRGPKKPSSRKPKVSGWTTEEAKKDEQLFKALSAIVDVYGKNDTMEIRKGTIGLGKPDIIALSKLPKSQMLAIQDLIMANHWTPKHALRFISEKPDDQSRLAEMQNWCLATKNKSFSVELGGFTHICKAN